MIELQPGQLLQNKVATHMMILLLERKLEGKTVMWACRWWNGRDENRIENFSEEGILRFWLRMENVNET